MSLCLHSSFSIIILVSDATVMKILFQRAQSTLLNYQLFHYDSLVPIPGGCNLEFEMETAPWLRVTYNQNVVAVEHELASIPPGCIGVPRCKNELLDYEIFQYYLNQRDFSQNSFFDAIRQFRTVEGAHQSGREASVSLIGIFTYQ